jgi:protoporphyrinogen IX oxidase
MLWIKTLHIVFIVSWFAGLFYLPRIFVNLALESDPAATRRLLVMARKLFRFMNILAGPAIVFGLWLWMYGFTGGWIHVKLTIALLLLGYHYACARMLKQFENGSNTRSHIWYRWFNEIPTVALVIAVVMAVIKPF